MFFEWETFGNSEMYSGEITQNFGLLSNIRFILKSLKKSHFTTFCETKFKEMKNISFDFWGKN